MDTHRRYVPQSKQKAAKRREKDEATHISLWPTSATLATMAAPFTYYALLVWHPSPYHDLHQVGILVALPLGYLLGLAMSLGGWMRMGSLWGDLTAALRGEQF